MDRNNLESKLGQLYRENFGKMVTALVSYFGLQNLAQAEDIVQETFVSAFRNWEKQGIPDNPLAWLYKVCKNKVINELNKKTHQTELNYFQLNSKDTVSYHIDQLFLDTEIKDNQLRLLFACCHPVLSQKAQIILTLKSLAGFKVDEIARGMMMNEEAVAKMLVRTRKILKDNNIQLKVPFLLQSVPRLDAVHKTLYLIFNEGYSASSGNEFIRKDLCLEALKLCKSLLNVPEISNSETQALFSLMVFNIARFDARIGSKGEMIELELQDRNV